MESCAGIILAGGRGTRMNGCNKGLLEVGGKTILERVLEVLGPRFKEILLIAKDPAAFLAYDVPILSDIFPVPGALTGIHAGLYYTSCSHGFIVSCDMPFLSGKVVDCILSAWTPGCDVVIPATREGIQPLCAVYSKQCMEHAARNIRQGRMSIRDFFDKVRLVRVKEPALRAADPELLSFFNINTPEEWEKARELAGRIQGDP